MARRHYSDADRAAALAVLAANGGNLTRAAREIGMPVPTLRSWVDAPDRAAPAELRAQKKADLADVLLDIAMRSLGLMGDGLAHLEALPVAERGRAALDRFPDLNRAAGTAIDKRQLVSGEPTQRVETRDTTEVERRTARILKLVDDADSTGTGKAAKSA